MARDLKFTQNNKGLFDIDFENGDFQLTDSLDTAFFMSIFYKQRATETQVSVPILREGHYTNIFNDDPNYQVGCYYWLYTEQGKLTNKILNLVSDTVRNDGLQWLIDNNIVSDINVTVTKANAGTINIVAEFTAKDEQNSRYYEAYINTFN